MKNGLLLTFFILRSSFFILGPNAAAPAAAMARLSARGPYRRHENWRKRISGTCSQAQPDQVVVASQSAAVPATKHMASGASGRRRANPASATTVATTASPPWARLGLG